jgi:D-3-phosphoglycerate dehydrogenase
MKVKAKVLISTSSFGRISQRPLEMLSENGLEYQLNPYGRKLTVQESATLCQDIDGLIAGTEVLNREVLLQASRLGVISRCGTGLDNVDLDTAAELGIRVYNTPDAHVDAVAELTIAGILDVMRRVSLADQLVRQGEWRKPMGGLLLGKTVGIIGLGRVGKALVKLLQPFKNHFLAYDPVKDEGFAQAYNVGYCSLNDLLKKSDIVTLHLTYDREAHHLIDRPRLELMKPTAILVNCARGGIIDELALYEHLKKNEASGAYLDTFEQEPYRGPLTKLPNAVLTPHIGSYAKECRTRMEIEAVENLCEFFREQEGQ